MRRTMRWSVLVCYVHTKRLAHKKNEKNWLKYLCEAHKNLNEDSEILERSIFTEKVWEWRIRQEKSNQDAAEERKKGRRNIIKHLWLNLYIIDRYKSEGYNDCLLVDSKKKMAQRWLLFLRILKYEITILKRYIKMKIQISFGKT